MTLRSSVLVRVLSSLVHGCVAPLRRADARMWLVQVAIGALVHACAGTAASAAVRQQ